MTPPYGRKWRASYWRWRWEWKSWLKTLHSENKDHGIWSHHFITKRWGNSGWLYFLGSKITADSDCSHEIKRCLLLGRKVMTNLDSILKKQGHYFANKGSSSQGYGFSSGHVWMWELDYKESWAQQNWTAFELWCWRRLLRVPWIVRRSIQSILKEISPEYSLEELCWIWNSNTLATWCEELTHQRKPWC